MSQQWFCELNGKIQGPFPLAVLREYEASGSVQQGTQVCEAGTEYWFEARKIKGLFPDELTWSEAESSERELFPTAFPSPPPPAGMASSCPEQRPASLRMRPQTTASRARTQPANRIRHRRSLAEYAVLSLILFSVVGVLVYSVRQLHDLIARRLALLPVIAAIEATEQTQDDTDAFEERPPNLPPVIGSGKPGTLTDWDFTDSRPNNAGNGVSAVESDSASMDAVTNIQESERVASKPHWQAPAIKLARLNGEDEFRLSDYRSEKVVLLDFWATWCGPCIQELPILTQIVSEYQDDEVALIAVNAQEKPSTIHRFLQTSGLDIEVALDEYGEAADAFGVEQLPTLVMIDKQGVVQRIHVGFDQRLLTIVKSELDALVAGESLDLPHHSVASLNKRLTDSPLMGADAQPWEELSVKQHRPPEFRLVLSSGRTIEFAKIFGEIGKAFERSLKERLTQSKPRLLRFNYDGSSQPSLLISRRGKELHGPLASFYEDGSPLAYASYRNGERTSTLFTWDETKQPRVFEQYRSGQKHGLRCLFKSCGFNCDTGHIWLVQEWDRGELKMAHVVLQDGSPVTVSYQYGHPDQTDDETMDELAAANAELDRFEKRLDTDEKKVRIATAEYHTQLQRVVFAQARARLMAAQHRLPSLQFAGLSMMDAPTLRIRTPTVSLGRSIGCAPVRNTGRS